MPEPTLDTTMAELMERWPAASVVAARHGMACVGCSMGRFETVSEAAEAYGLDPRAFLREVLAQVRGGRAPDRRLRRRKDASSRSRNHSR